MGGNYVNFGVFELYGDRALADALDISLKMTLAIPMADILSYRKVGCFSCHKDVELIWKSRTISLFSCSVTPTSDNVNYAVLFLFLIYIKVALDVNILSGNKLVLNFVIIA